LREEEQDINNIKNDIAREVLKIFKCKPVTITFNTDAHSSGTGLASSSSYTIAAIAALSKFTGKTLSNHEICKLALEIERKFNPLTGYQDPYGCGIGSFKKFIFKKNIEPSITFLDSSFFEGVEIKLCYTGQARLSTNVLKKQENADKKELLRIVNLMENRILEKDLNGVLELIKMGWEHKKIISPITDEKILEIDNRLSTDDNILAHRLCGAGNGGYFLIFSKKDAIIQNTINIKIENEGVKIYEI
jgi:D-glycero-alpha-D-manno-heptose-7-phosphate kinase